MKVDNQLSVLICIDSFYDGGAEMFAIRLANSLCKRVKVHFMELQPDKSTDKKQLSLLSSQIAVFTPNNGFFLKLLKIKAVRKVLTKVKLVQKFNKLVDIQISSEIYNYLYKYEIKTVNTHAPFCNYYLSHVKSKLRFKLVHTFHGHYELMRKSWRDEDKFWTFVNSHFGVIDSFIYTTSEHKNLLIEAKVDRIKRKKIFYGLDINVGETTTKFDKNETLIIGMVSRADKEKGWRVVIEAVNDLINAGDKLRVEILGSGDDYPFLREKYGNNENIIFHGYKENVFPIMRKCHIGILATIYEAESLPNVIIEFLSLGKPVISTTVGAIPDMIKSGNLLAGRLMHAKKGVPLNVGQIKEAIKSYLNNPGLVEKESKLAYTAVQKFSMEKCVDEYLKIFEIPKMSINNTSEYSTKH